jgi:hypothetical protein
MDNGGFLFFLVTLATFCALFFLFTGLAIVLMVAGIERCKIL